jgi:hypothetical protein
VQQYYHTILIAYQKSIICGKHDKIFFLLYKLLLDLSKHNMFHSEWLYKFESIMNDTAGLSEYWFTQNIPSNISVKKSLKIVHTQNISKRMLHVEQKLIILPSTFHPRFFSGFCAS